MVTAQAAGDGDDQVSNVTSTYTLHDQAPSGDEIVPSLPDVSHSGSDVEDDDPSLSDVDLSLIEL
jgi:hypothetical protein